MINLELYKIFYVVAETKNITKASEILNISQPAVTKQIRNLETQLNTPLFIRTKKGVILNECGKKIFLNVKQGLTIFNEIETEVKDYCKNNYGTIRIGTSTTLIKIFLLEFIKKFHNLYPNIIIDIHTDPTKELIQKLKNGTIDFIIGKFPTTFDKDLNYIELNNSEYIFVANKKYFNINYSLKPEDFNKYPILLQDYPSNSRSSAEKYFKNNNIILEPKMNIASSHLLIEFIKMGYGIGYVTKLYVENELKKGILYEIPLISKTEKISFGLITLKNNIMTKQCIKFIESIKKYWN